ncbi:MAG: S46 family peptidase [Bacteroidetes bacterium]|nr:S46 family peptidase [Bacteroidota bacterium]
MKKLISLLFIIKILVIPDIKAEEGMWLPHLLALYNESQMQEMGFRLTAEDIYSINHSGMKDGIVRFGGGCTGVIVSAEGLLLTNHHCGFGSIQDHSSLEHDYLAHGFWAMEREDELPNPGLTVALLVKIEDVTRAVLDSIPLNINELDRRQRIESIIGRMRKERSENGKYEVQIRSFYGGNEYYQMTYRIFRDIRMVGAPPVSIGNFGGDTDNWMWPRHTCDFSVFRIYANEQNEPAPYAETNVPYKPQHYFPVSLQGVREGDFTLVFGYPGTTREYLPASAIRLIVEEENPVRIRIREKKLEIIKQEMEQSRLIRIQYADKRASIANYWKKMIGESRGIRRLDAIRTKLAEEETFTRWATENKERQDKYGNILPAFSRLYEQYAPLKVKEVYLTEAILGVELIRQAGQLKELATESQKQIVDTEKIGLLKKALIRSWRLFYKDYQAAIDRQLMTAMFRMTGQYAGETYRPPFLEPFRTTFEGDPEKYTRHFFSKTFLTDSTAVISLLEKYQPKDHKKIIRDEAYKLSQAVIGEHQSKVKASMIPIERKLDSLQRIYIKAQREMHPGNRFYPDANSTLRVAYGKVDDYFPRDAVHYTYFTTLAGMMEKEDTTIVDYKVDARLKELYERRDFGLYADRDGTLHTCFTASNHTTGGNSGSPVINANGELIGLNFDRNWEGTMSDLAYDPDMCRNITLDIRYCLFIIDKYAGARRLIDEMTLR